MSKAYPSNLTRVQYEFLSRHKAMPTAGYANACKAIAMPNAPFPISIIENPAKRCEGFKLRDDE
ncbi:MULTISPECIES: hypothetical protein [unclassified Nostoc]|uniref:hypothetical protein n=1 Tax=unclassified Nostoc TaxID=2593658 RepID=UPI0025AA9CE0|nr:MULTISPECIES: hypothetical protein [unclassified Nostoc]MDM9585223.1 hypothetical protein [Nostoc sp. GT001]MDZ7944805.1 hypothetical protein [Nostoc sp. EfeVER01]MDZ7994102.1 hypothetical protein [Nostoc sp. EspVER01]